MSLLGTLAFGLACAVTIPLLVGWLVHRTGGTWAPHPDPQVHRTQPNKFVANVCLCWAVLSAWMMGRNPERWFY